MSKSVVRIGRRGKGVESSAVQGREGQETHLLELDTRVELIQALIPIGLEAVNEVLQQEVCQLAGERYRREGGVPGYARWGGQRGSVYLADQKVAIAVPRVRDRRRGQEVPLSAYQALQDPRRAEDASLRKVLKGLSCRDYEPCVDAVSETFGLSSSSLSRRFKRASGKKLAELAERDLSGYDIVALFLDGKTFGDDQMVIALGVTMKGEKVVLGFVQTATENERVCSAFLRSLLDRGLNVDQGVLCVIDGAKGLRKAVGKVLAAKAAVQRCQWHKRENVVRYLATSQQATAVLDIEPRFRKVVGYRQLSRLRAALQSPSHRTGKAVP